MSRPETASRRKVARVEDADESDNPIEGTEIYAESVASPNKERPNTGRARREKARRDSTSPLTSGLNDSDSTVHPREKPARDRERRESRDSRSFPSPHKKALAISEHTLAMRPAAKHANTTPHLSYGHPDEAAYYGVPTVTPATSYARPRAATQRPASYYGTQSRPPQANAQFWARQPMTLVNPTSYPPQTWAQAGPMVHPMMSPAAPPPPPDYFVSQPVAPIQHLQARLGGRPQSAMGMRPSPSLVREDYAPEEERYLVRRSSKKTRDRMAMPPPARPQSARPGLVFRPPSTPAPRKGIRFEDEELDPEDLFHASPLTYEYAPAERPPRIRRPSFGAPSLSYDSGAYRTEVAGNNRRNSYRNSLSSGDNDWRERARQAQAYQETVVGEEPAPLTKESLRRVSRDGPGSRSTRSSASHDESRDESDYRQSATTRTTRSSNNNSNMDDDVTIRIKGVRSVEVGGAKMQCDKGAEINIASRGPAPSTGYRGGSDRSSYMGAEDRYQRIEDSRRLPRIERPPTRTRTRSQAGSFSRSSVYEASHAPMPRYESVELDEFGYPLPQYTSYPPPRPPPGYI